MLMEDLYRGKISPYSTIMTKNGKARDRLDKAQEALLAALPEEKRSLIDASQDAYMELVMDEGEAAFAEGVKFGIRLMTEIFSIQICVRLIGRGGQCACECVLHAEESFSQQPAYQKQGRVHRAASVATQINHNIFNRTVFTINHRMGFDDHANRIFGKIAAII